MPFTILPAIDLIDGQAVRLRQGDYQAKTIYSRDPLEVAQRFQAEGATWLHVVDLDGAKAGRPINHAVVERIVAGTGLKVEVGGGIREAAHWKTYLDMNVSRVILGSIALRKPERLEEAAAAFPRRVVLGLDARNGRVAVEGWTETSQATAAEVLVRFAALSLAAVIYTDIARDGTLTGPNLEETLRLADASPFPVILSGGISSLNDVKRVVEASRLHPQLAGLITGKALYENRFKMADLVELLAG